LPAELTTELLGQPEAAQVHLVACRALRLHAAERSRHVPVADELLLELLVLWPWLWGRRLSRHRHRPQHQAASDQHPSCRPHGFASPDAARTRGRHDLARLHTRLSFLTTSALIRELLYNIGSFICQAGRPQFASLPATVSA